MKKDLIFYFSLLLLSIILSYKTQGDYTYGIAYVLLFVFADLLKKCKTQKLTYIIHGFAVKVAESHIVTTF